MTEAELGSRAPRLCQAGHGAVQCGPSARRGGVRRGAPQGVPQAGAQRPARGSVLAKGAGLVSGLRLRSVCRLLSCARSGGPSVCSERLWRLAEAKKSKSPPQGGRSIALPRRAALGHEDQFPPSSLSSRFGLGEATFAGTRGNGRDAPIAVIPARASNCRAQFNRAFDVRSRTPGRCRERHSRSAEDLRLSSAKTWSRLNPSFFMGATTIP